MNLKFEKAENRKYEYVAYLDNIEIGEAEDNVGEPIASFLLISMIKYLKFQINTQYQTFLKRIYVLFHYR
jgi:hypothetical protein